MEIGYWLVRRISISGSGRDFDKSHVPAVGSNQLHNAVVAPGKGAFFVDVKGSVQEVGC